MADALVLAAGENHGRLAELSGVQYRALIEVEGRPMVERALTALRAARSTGRIAVVAPPEVVAGFPRELADLIVEPRGSLIDNVMCGLEALADSPMVMFAHPDAPLMTAAALDDFMAQAEPLGPDLAYAIVAREVVEQRFPHGHRTYLHLREGTFTGSNVVLVKPAFIASHRELIEEFYENRKHPLHLVGMLGAGFLLRLVTGRLTVAQLEQRIGQIVGGNARAIISHYPELAFDVDKAEDLETIRAVLGN